MAKATQWVLVAALMLRMVYLYQPTQDRVQKIQISLVVLALVVSVAVAKATHPIVKSKSRCLESLLVLCV